MTNDSNIHGDGTPTGTPNTGNATAIDRRAVANMAAADTYAGALKPILLELLISKSRCKRLTPTGWHLTDLAQKLNERGIRTRAGKLFRPTTVKRLLDRMPDIVEAAGAARSVRFDANFKHSLGINAPASAADASAGLTIKGISHQSGSLGA